MSFSPSPFLASRHRLGRKERTTSLQARMWFKDPSSTTEKGTLLGAFFCGGGWWIRTTEVSDNRFTVCPLWPLGNSPIVNSLWKTRWSWWTDLNPRPADYKSAALPAELHQRISHDAHHYSTSKSPCQYLFEKFPIFYFFAKSIDKKILV